MFLLYLFAIQSNRSWKTRCNFCRSTTACRLSTGSGYLRQKNTIEIISFSSYLNKLFQENHNNFSIDFKWNHPDGQMYQMISTGLQLKSNDRTSNFEIIFVQNSDHTVMIQQYLFENRQMKRIMKV